jgi:hypothetical protein
MTKNYTEPGNLEPPVEDLDEEEMEDLDEEEMEIYTVQHCVKIYRIVIVRGRSIDEADLEAQKQFTKYLDGDLTKPFNMLAANIFQDYRDKWEHLETSVEWGNGAPLAPTDHKDTVYVDPILKEGGNDE